MTYAAVVQDARRASAQELLKEHRRRIGDVARILGYSDPAHFSRGQGKIYGRARAIDGV